MKKIICINLFLVITMFSLNIFSNSSSNKFIGKYYFDECYGKTKAETGICFEFNIEIYNYKNQTKAKYSIDGFQTMRRFICNVKKNGKYFDVIFEKYDEDDIHYTENYKKGKKLFQIFLKNEKYFITNFESPYDGKIITKVYELKKIPNG